MLPSIWSHYALVAINSNVRYFPESEILLYPNLMGQEFQFQCIKNCKTSQFQEVGISNVRILMYIFICQKSNIYHTSKIPIFDNSNVSNILIHENFVSLNSDVPNILMLKFWKFQYIKNMSIWIHQILHQVKIMEILLCSVFQLQNQKKKKKKKIVHWKFLYAWTLELQVHQNSANTYMSLIPISWNSGNSCQNYINWNISEAKFKKFQHTEVLLL